MDKLLNSRRFPWLYFGLVFLLAVPFWVFGDRRLPLAVNLPVSAVGFVVPVIAAAIYAYRQAGREGVSELLRRAVDFKRIKNKAWLAVRSEEHKSELQSPKDRVCRL